MEIKNSAYIEKYVAKVREKSLKEERNYKKEYANYQGKPEQIARRSSRNKARRLMGDKNIKGKDIGHKDNNPLNNDPKNLKIEDPSTNRREPRLREDGHTAVAKVRAAHKRDDERNKVKRDRELDRARTQDTARKNTQTRVRGESVIERFKQSDVVGLEKFADRILKKYGVDIEFTKHFVDRINDPRNSPEIKVSELQRFFKKIQKNKAKNIINNPDTQAVLKDISTNLNLPVVIKTKGDEIEVTNKTIMRKQNFKTPNKVIKYESFRTFSEATESVVFTFGRFNPPTTGHEKLLDKVKKIAGGDDYYIFPSHSQNPKKDPLPFAKKVAYMRDMFPKHKSCLLYTSPSPRDVEESRMPSSA